MRIYLILLLVTLVCSCSYSRTYADSTSNSLSLSIPNSTTSFQADKFRAGELDCSNAIGSATNIEFGVTGIIQGGTTGHQQVGDIGVYSKITIPLGKRDELELQKKELEVMKLQQEINQLRSLSFEN